MTTAYEDPLRPLLKQYWELVSDRVHNTGKIITALGSNQVKAYVDDKGSLRIEVGLKPFLCDALQVADDWMINAVRRDEAAARQLLLEAIQAETPPTDPDT